MLLLYSFECARARKTPRRHDLTTAGRVHDNHAMPEDSVITRPAQRELAFFTQAELKRLFAVMASKRDRTVIRWPTGMACV
jgi:hypothetical protein